MELEVQYLVHISQSLHHILSYINPLYTLVFFFVNMYFMTTVSQTPIYTKWSFHFRISNKRFVRLSEAILIHLINVITFGEKQNL